MQNNVTNRVMMLHLSNDPFSFPSKNCGSLDESYFIHTWVDIIRILEYGIDNFEYMNIFLSI